MSSEAPTGSQNGTPADQQPSLEADIALLQKLLAEDGDESNPENVAALLKRLEAAEGLAGGVEDRLDGIMDHLDTLLTDLEERQEQGVGAPEAEAEAEAKASVAGVVTGSEGRGRGARFCTKLIMLGAPRLDSAPPRPAGSTASPWASKCVM
uniref:Lid2 complex component lid2 n=1 Tax=Ganoderma boninense TaxID=34458 RepID=A0A5K1K5W4_9APHY|nr:Lid2 complex component lid2 [Ganoderma boninense]